MYPISKIALKRIVLILFTCVISISEPASALENYEYRILQDQLWYEKCDTGGGTAETTPSPASNDNATTELGKVYVLGDSISVAAKSEFEKQFKAAGATDVKVNAIVGRNLTSSGSGSQTGLQAIDADKDYIKDANTIIIEQGTNELSHSGSYPDGQQAIVKQAMSKLKATGTKGKIYWVDVAISAKGPGSYPSLAGRINKVIYSSSSEGYSVISWAKVVDPSVDPANQTGPVKDDKNKLSDGIHPSNSVEYVENIVNGVKGGGGGSQSNNSSNSGTSKNDKIAKMLIPLFDVGAKDTALKAIEKYKFGGMAMTGNGAGSVYNKAFFDQAKSKAGSPFIPMADEEGGNVSRYGIETLSATDMGKLSTDRVKQEGQKTGNGLKGYGIEADLAPVLDIDYNLSNHLGHTRAFGTNANDVIAKAGAFASGLNAAGVKPTYKHFPGLGRATANTDVSPVTLNYNDLQDDLKPFKELGNQNSGMVMLTNAIISGIGGTGPAPTNPALIQKLRGEVGFSGTIITDDLTAVSKWPGQPDLPTLVANSIKAGANLIIITWPGDDVMDKILEKAGGAVPDSRVSSNQAEEESKQTSSDDSSDECCASGSSSSSASASVSTGDGGGCGSQTDAQANKKQMWDFFKNKGIPDAGIAGILGNSQVESGFMPQADNEKTMGYRHPATGRGCVGVFQWCDRRPNLESFAKERGKNWDCLGIQLEFSWSELQSQKKEALQAMKAAKSPSQAAKAWDDTYEISGGSNMPGRISNAEAIYKEYAGKAAAAQESNSTTGNDDSSSKSCPSTDDTATDDSVPPAECGAVVAEALKLVQEGKLKSINNNSENFKDDLKHCGKVNSSSSGCVGVMPEIVRVAIGLTKFIDSKGLGPVTFANFNKGHDCDGGKHTHGNAFDLWYGECNNSSVYTNPKCVESVKWLIANNKAYNIGAAMHNPVALQGLPNNVAGGNKDGVQLYWDTENEMIHTSTGKDGRW